MIFVTHDRYFLDVIATRIIELADGRCFSHPGNYTAYLESKAIRQQISRTIRAAAAKVFAGGTRLGARQACGRSGPSHGIACESFTRSRGLEAPPEEREMDLLIPPAPEMGNCAMELVNAGASVTEGETGAGSFAICSLELKPGQCTGVVGRNGVGKTTLLRLCLGEREPDEGTVKIGRKVMFNYIDQARMQLKGTGTVLDEIAEGSESVLFG